MELANYFDLELGFPYDLFHGKDGGVVKRFIDSCIDANSNGIQFKECQRRLWKKNEVLRILIGCAV